MQSQGIGEVLCYLPDWANTLLLIGCFAAFFFSRHRLIERTEERVRRQIAEMDAWNRMTPAEQADWLIYGEPDVRPYKGRQNH
jgi:hypothetical protein